MSHRVLLALAGLLIGGGVFWLVRRPGGAGDAVPRGTPVAPIDPPAPTGPDPDDEIESDPLLFVLDDDGSIHRARGHDGLPSALELREHAAPGRIDGEVWYVRTALDPLEKPSERRRAVRALLVEKARFTLAPELIDLIRALHSEERSPTVRGRLTAAEAALKRGERWERAFDAAPVAEPRTLPEAR